MKVFYKLFMQKNDQRVNRVGIVNKRFLYRLSLATKCHCSHLLNIQMKQNFVSIPKMM